MAVTTLPKREPRYTEAEWQARVDLAAAHRTLSCSSSSRWSGEGAIDLASHVALQASHQLAFGQTLAGPSGDVGSGARVGPHPAHDDHVQGGVGLSVSAAVEAMAFPGIR